MYRTSDKQIKTKTRSSTGLQLHSSLVRESPYFNNSNHVEIWFVKRDAPLATSTTPHLLPLHYFPFWASVGSNGGREYGLHFTKHQHGNIFSHYVGYQPVEGENLTVESRDKIKVLWWMCDLDTAMFLWSWLQANGFSMRVPLAGRSTFQCIPCQRRTGTIW